MIVLRLLARLKVAVSVFGLFLVGFSSRINAGDQFSCTVIAPASPAAAVVVINPPAAQAKEEPDPPTPVVNVKVRVPAEANVNEELEYKIVVENSSQSPAHHVVVRSPLAAGVKLVRASPEPNAKDPELIWRLGTLGGGSKQEITLIVIPTVAGTMSDCTRVQFEHGQCTTTKVRKRGIQVRREGPKEASVGEMLKFKLTITNTGDTELSRIELEEKLPPGFETESKQALLRWDMAYLNPGESESTEYTVKALAAGKLCSLAQVRAEGSVSDQIETCVEVREPKLKLMKSGPEKRYVDHSALYQITVENAGEVPLTGVRITDNLPGQAAVVRASDNGELQNDKIVWALGNLEPGTSRTVELELKAQAEGTFINQAIAETDRGLAKKAEIRTTFAGIATLALDVKHDNDPLEVGGTLAYDIKVRNPGTSVARNVVVVVTPPEQLAIIRAGGDAEPEKTGNEIRYKPVTIPAGGQVNFHIEAKAVRPGIHVRMKVRLEAEQLRNGAIEQEEVATIYPVMPVSLRKKLRQAPLASRLRPAN